MFNGRKIAALEAEIQDLRNKHYENLTEINKLRAEVLPYRIGPLPANYFHVMFPLDPRPQVTLREAVDLLMEHLNLSFSHTKEVPARTQLQQVKS